MRIYDTPSFIEKAKIIHNAFYDYSLTKYIRSSHKVKIICPLHGIFTQTPNNHARGQGCMYCGFIARSSIHYSNTNTFVSSAGKVHNNKYRYDKTIYRHSEKLVIITCPSHGDFLQKPFKHLQGQGCPKCRNSKGQARIEKYLIEHRLDYKSEVRLNECKNKRALPFDFAIYDKYENLVCLIEFQGQQHFEPTEHFGGKKQLLYIQKNDQIKRKYCSSKNIPLLEIRYTNIATIEKRIAAFLYANVYV